MIRRLFYAIIIYATLNISTRPVWADDNAQAPEAPPAAPTLQPIMLGPLVANLKPMTYEAGPLGKVYFSGILSGLGLLQNNVYPGDHQNS